MSLLLPGLLSLLLAAALTAYLASPIARIRWLDVPNERSLHRAPVPRTGGLGILGGALAGWLALSAFAMPPAWLAWPAAATLLVAGVSLLDDWRGLPVLARLAAHGTAATMVLMAGLLPGSVAMGPLQLALPGWIMAPVMLLFLVWMINLYNFMDGMDGFAGGMAAVGFGTMALLGALAGADLFAGVTLSIALAAGGFLLFNFPPARIFMGDAGASTLGLLAGVAMLWADHESIFPIWIGVLIFSPFIADATMTLVARALRREPVWRPHRSHCYQRLVRSGWGHRRTVVVAYGLMLLSGAGALAALHWAHPVVDLLIVLVFVAIYATIYTYVQILREQP
ncbi:MraY family glycosyltransferase [Thioalkalivibrio paradoxus]|uniref:Glycosyl transferase family 4 n=1 Tax=Thioalkalivibrio paradoxus ARh 1 TaxID=713585 RepID=W0DNH5_9GAMM|nr:glycosyltransferase family 4 protein [Thioalkalivibrio paradoxus]AHE98548.1 glycosyl transferase family 4 [Thioalkalivibrio paradoxus ARh 1]